MDLASPTEPARDGASRARIPPCIADDFCTLMRMPQLEAAGSKDALDSGDSWAIFYSVRG
jgi:hypothetical protein